MQDNEYTFEASSEMDKLTIECLCIIENIIDACDNPDEVTDYQLPKVLLTAMEGKLLVAEKYPKIMTVQNLWTIIIPELTNSDIPE